ncbi:hypothetical protein [Polynucleobacter sp.]|uniref:hypothetical protein n=1 Tax=Polynucleobacter sp. TaxID=2029855 RepID=UPI003F6A1303
MKNCQLIILLGIYAFLIWIGWLYIEDSTKLQTWAIVVSGFILIWYSWETRLLRVVASDQKDQQIQPLIIYENRRAGHYIKNIGSGVALNVEINRVLVGGSNDIEIVFPNLTPVLSPGDEIQVKGQFKVQGIELSDIHGTAHLSTDFSNQTSIISIHYSNIDCQKYLTTEQISPGKVEVLKVQKLSKG